MAGLEFSLPSQTQRKLELSFLTKRRISTSTMHERRAAEQFAQNVRTRATKEAVQNKTQPNCSCTCTRLVHRVLNLKTTTAHKFPATKPKLYKLFKVATYKLRTMFKQQHVQSKLTSNGLAGDKLGSSSHTVSREGVVGADWL